MLVKRAALGKARLGALDPPLQQMSGRSSLSTGWVLLSSEDRTLLALRRQTSFACEAGVIVHLVSSCMLCAVKRSRLDILPATRWYSLHHQGLITAASIT